MIRGDVFPPAEIASKVPVLVDWSPYRKIGCGVSPKQLWTAVGTDLRKGYFNLGIIPHSIGVPQSRLSGFESFEAPDPAE
jgi:hypothetical protein